ncbi:MAG: hypothetical protein JXC36_04040 [Candidatus Atribacteria bacterium]|nr:hypothetical protein [Candidatus Atribacteria bacterium]
MKIIGVDVGTSGLKISVYDTKVNILESDIENYTVQSPFPGIVELDPMITWRAFKRKLSHLLKSENVEDQEYIMSFSVLGDALIVADEKFYPILPSILSSDTRSTAYSKIIRKQLSGRKLYSTTGRFPHPMSILNRLLWLQDHNVVIFKEARWYLDYPSWILSKLGFTPLTDYSSASGTLYFDIYKKDYDKEILSWANIPREKLPSLISSGKYIGNLSEKVKQELGFSKKCNVSVVSGGMDQICNALGTGTVRPNQMVCSIGTVEATTTVLPDEINQEELFLKNYFCSVSAIPDQFVTFSFLWAGGGSLRWYKDNLSDLGNHVDSNHMAYDDIVGNEIKPNKEIFLPYLSGTGPPFWDSMARGAFLGLDLSSKKQNMVDSLLEGVCFDLRHNLEQLKKAGIEVKRISVVGGGSKSSKWLQIKSDIIKKPIYRLERQEGGSLGAALLAGYGVGLFKDLTEIAQKVNQVGQVFYPSDQFSKLYDQKYKIFTEAYSKLRNIHKKINSIYQFDV